MFLAFQLRLKNKKGNKMMGSFKQRSARLYNGQKVKVGDRVSFVNSDGEKQIDTVQYSVNNPKKLFFWNDKFEIKCYQNAIKEPSKSVIY